MDGFGKIAPPRLVAWETTAACNLACRHCRAEAVSEPLPGQLEPEESQNLLRQLALWEPKPMVILSGGEPLMRPDILDLAYLGTSLGMRMLLSTNGTMMTPSLAKEIKASGVARLSVSLDGPTAKEHDSFRGLAGSFDSLVQGVGIMRAERLPFQINTTITAYNISQIPAITSLAEELGAIAHHVFLLVPVGRALNLASESSVRPEDYEEALVDLKTREPFLKLDFKATCAPQYNRIGRQLGIKGSRHSGRGCLGGQGFMFVSHAGEVRACGYLPLAAGNVRQEHPMAVYENSALFKSLRNREEYLGRCRDCEYWSICGGCRARAHSAGNFLGSEPLCPHEPKKRSDNFACK
ncbi:MAG: radical SAM protein [Deltaproteobacteria bacterium]|jgi:radical SAM protein with 4Fe4S-binding SPASM domain|nr:radical SAM protein [Deltaproteobacteria bacterium]